MSEGVRGGSQSQCRMSETDCRLGIREYITRQTRFVTGPTDGSKGGKRGEMKGTWRGETTRIDWKIGKWRRKGGKRRIRTYSGDISADIICSADLLRAVENGNNSTGKLRNFI